MGVLWSGWDGTGGDEKSVEIDGEKMVDNISGRLKRVERR